MRNESTPLMGKAVWLRWIVVIGLLAALPLAFFRWQTEVKSTKVEVVMDYTDVISLSANSSNPMAQIVQTLALLNTNSITSVAVDELNFEDVRMQHRMMAWTGDQIGMLEPLALDSNDTYLSFTEEQGLYTAEQTRNWIQEALANQGIVTVDWTVPRELRVENKVMEQGLRVARGIEELKVTLLGIDPLSLQQVKDAGLQPVVKISNRIKPFDSARFSRDVQSWSEAGVKRLIFFGDEAPGFDYITENSKVAEAAAILKSNAMGLSVIEMLKKNPAGFDKMAKAVNYDVVRLHSINEKDPLLLQPDQADAVDQLTDRLVLAVKDRGIRMVYLNAKWIVDRERMIQINPLTILFDVLNKDNGAIAQWKALGFELAPAEALEDQTDVLWLGMKVFVAIAALAWMIILVRYFIPLSPALLFIIGLIVGLGLGYYSEQWLWKSLALGVGIASSTTGILMVLNKGWIIGGSNSYSRMQKAGLAIGGLLYATLFSLGGALLIVGLLNEIPYYLVLDQYRGVVLLHSIPLLLAALYALFYWQAYDWNDVFERVKSWMDSPVKIAGLIVFVIGAGAFAYYLTRTGNEGAVSPIERMYRTYLETFFGVRPRTKEFLIAHPMFLLAAFAWRVPRWRLAVVLFGALGQLSIVDTFAHLHTPLWVSLVRIALGIGIGIVLAIGYSIAWEIVRGSWKRWVSRLAS